MCGIVGLISEYSNGFSASEMSLFLQNLVVNQVRGSDSTGVFSVNNKHDPALIKAVGGVSHLLSAPSWKTFQQDMLWNGKIAVGHGRAATRGSVTTENAHPFRVPYDDDKEHSIYLVHNGTLHYHQSLPDFYKYDVDSHWLAHCLQAHGPEETLSRVGGAMALVWWDSKTKTINFFRNHERPLHFTTVEDTGRNETMLLNSEAAALRWLIARNGLKITQKHDVYVFEEMKWYSLPFDDLQGDFIVKKITRKIQSSAVWEGYHGRDWSASPIAVPVGTDTKNAMHYAYDSNRTYLKDVRALLQGHFNVVRWEGTTRITSMTGGYTIRQLDCPPYEPGMVCMFLATKQLPNSATLRVEFLDAEAKRLIIDRELNQAFIEKALAPNAPTSSSTEKEGGSQGETFPARLVTTDHTNYSAFVNPAKLKRFRTGRAFNFHTKDFKQQTIKHSGVISQGVLLERYSNEVDPPIRLNEEVIVELADYEPIRMTDTTPTPNLFYMKAYRVRPDGKMDQYVNCFWYVRSENAAKQLCDNPTLFKGTVRQLRFAEKAVYNDTGAVVEVMLSNVVPISKSEAADSCQLPIVKEETPRVAH